MPRGDKSAYTDKQKRMAKHIEEGYEDRGVSEKEAVGRAWATVNATDHGGKKEWGRPRQGTKSGTVEKGWTTWRGGSRCSNTSTAICLGQEGGSNEKTQF